MERSRSGTARELQSGRWQVHYRTLDGRRITARDTFANKADVGPHILPVIDFRVPALGKVALVDMNPALARPWHAAVERCFSHSTAGTANLRLRQIRFVATLSTATWS